MMTEPAIPDASADAEKYPIREAFRRFYPRHAAGHGVTPEQDKAARLISKCKTGELGYNVSYCEECGHMEIHACSCNNRNCPCCQSPLERKWVMERNAELVPGCAYYHCVFTVPFELNNLIYENQKLLYGLMFSAASSTLITLCRDKRHMGATPGIIEVLHTWGQRLNFHPHIHCALSGGGLTESGRFREAKHKGFVLPVRAVGAMFRGKFMAGVKALHDSGELALGGKCRQYQDPGEWKKLLDSLYKKDWCPFIKETFNGNGNAVEYLGRYAYRTAISNSRVIKVDGDTVMFRYKDYADGKEKLKTVAGEEFIRLFLQHVLPKGFSRIRMCGFLANGCKTRRLKLIHKLRGTEYIPNPTKGMAVADLLLALYGRDIRVCPECSGAMISYPRGRPPAGLVHTGQRALT